MKKIVFLSIFSLVLLAGPLSLLPYDESASSIKVIPECIWAPATGGGTWKTEIQLTNMASEATNVSVIFFYGGGLYQGPVPLVTGLTVYKSVRFTNILQTIDGIDPTTFTYYGRVGALWFTAGPDTHKIQVTAKTVNGNYGKTFPGLNVVEANTAAFLRQMVIHNLTHNATYRTFTGFFNTSVTATYTVTFTILDSSSATVGSSFSKSFPPFEYLAFNPFVEAGVGSGSYDNCWLFVSPTSGGSDVRGIMGYGAGANNTSNDPAALLAYPFN